MKQILKEYQILVGSVLICLTILLSSSTSGVFSAATFAGAADVFGSPNVAIAAFNIYCGNNCPGTIGPGVLEIMADGKHALLLTDGGWLSVPNLTGITFPHPTMMAYNPQANAMMAIGPGGAIYTMSNGGVLTYTGNNFP